MCALPNCPICGHDSLVARRNEWGLVNVKCLSCETVMVNLRFKDSSSVKAFLDEKLLEREKETGRQVAKAELSGVCPDCGARLINNDPTSAFGVCPSCHKRCPSW